VRGHPARTVLTILGYWEQGTSATVDCFSPDARPCRVQGVRGSGAPETRILLVEVTEQSVLVLPLPRFSRRSVQTLAYSVDWEGLYQGDTWNESLSNL